MFWARFQVRKGVKVEGSGEGVGLVRCSASGFELGLEDGEWLDVLEWLGEL